MKNKMKFKKIVEYEQEGSYSDSILILLIGIAFISLSYYFSLNDSRLSVFMAGFIGAFVFMGILLYSYTLLPKGRNVFWKEED